MSNVIFGTTKLSVRERPGNDAGTFLTAPLTMAYRSPALVSTYSGVPDVLLNAAASGTPESERTSAMSGLFDRIKGHMNRPGG